jgi:putative DNA methylase
MRQVKKLIEVALPLEAINIACSREKSIRHGHPSTLHLWWARRPLAAARAVIFAQMVDDPSSHPDLFPTPKKQEKERLRLFKIIEDLVKWENTTNETVLNAAREEIWQSWRRACADNADHHQAKELFNRKVLPAFHDPFAGGGAIPLEAQRLGLESYASDLNPVAVMINKAMIEIPPKFASKPPVNPDARKDKQLIAKEWKGAQGLAEDVRYYGQWMRDEAEKRIGHLYPKVKITKEMVKERPDLKQYEGGELTVIAWLWARTVKSPNPAFSKIDVPLASTFMISTKAGKEAYVEPVTHKDGYEFTVRVGKPKDAEGAKNGTKLARGANFKCMMSGIPSAPDYIKSEGRAGRMGARLMAIVAEGKKGRVYLSPIEDHEKIASKAKPSWKPDTPLANEPRALWTPPYGLTTFGDLFTPRQLVTLTTFSDLVQDAIKKTEKDAKAAGLVMEGNGLNEGGTGATAYAESVGVYLGFVLNKQADLGNSLCGWEPVAQCPRHLFGRQAIPMIWDFAEGNPLGESSGAWVVFVEGIAKAFAKSFEFVPATAYGNVQQADAGNQTISNTKVVSTDPPYYDNIGYADLSDFFYVWMRKALKPIFPDLFATLAVPKAEELIAAPYRHGGKAKAETFFLDGMTQAMHRLAEQAHPAFPVTIYYAFKQSESDSAEGTTNTGWDTFLAAVIEAGFSISGTWPMRTENETRMIGQGTNALASSIVLVCRKLPANAPSTTRRDFVSTLKAELPLALANLQRGNIAPVDLAQASIGPGMAVFTRFAKVLDAEGKPLTVREALALINQTLDESLAEQEGDFDSDSRWALAWFEQFGFDEGEYGVAEQLSKSKNTAINGLVEAGILKSSRGKVRLLKPSEFEADWDPTKDNRTPAWEVVHQLVKVLEGEGEKAAAELLKALKDKADTSRELAYRLYSLCERKKWAEDARSYNGLVVAWPELLTLANTVTTSGSKQQDMFS